MTALHPASLNTGQLDTMIPAADRHTENPGLTFVQN